MNKLTVVLCTPDMHRTTSLRTITMLKGTNLAGVELIIVDNACDQDFHHPSMMQQYLNYAQGGPVIFMDDDVLIKDPDWISKLTAAAQYTGASIVGCVHTYPGGEVNHMGVLVYRDGSTELLRESPEKCAKNALVPAVSSALMLVTDSTSLSFDTSFSKYQHDVDICLSAWKKGHRVALAEDLQVIHFLGDYSSKIAGWRDIYDEDSRRLERKWAEFADNGLYERPELDRFANISCGDNWEHVYNRASASASRTPGESAHIFRKVADDCPFNWRKAGAYFHLYRIEGDPEDLKRCVHLNPFHAAARNLFTQLMEK